MKTLTPFVALSLLASAIPAQRQLVLPDYQYLCESATQLGQVGSTAWWRGSGGRFQVLYEASHFTGKAGAGVLTIDKLLFRGESGEPNLGGQSWAGAVVSVGVTSLDPGDLVATFATNLAPGSGDATLMAPAVTIPLVTVAPSIGSTPNNYNIVVDLAALGSSYGYDPTSTLLPNLLIDITLPAATLPLVSGPVMAMEDTTGAIVVVRGRGVTSGVIGSLTGGLANPPVIGIEFSGSAGGYSPPVPARNEFYGAACGGEPCSFYQSFLNGQPFDLGGGSLTLTPNAPATVLPTLYTVTKTAKPFLPPVALVSTANNAVVPVTLPWAFRYPCGPAGGTTAISACTNGYVWLDPAMLAADASPTVTELLGAFGNTARLAPFWYDFDCGKNLPTHPLSGLYVDIAGFAGFRTCAITWLDVGVANSVSGVGIGGHAVHHMQCQIHEATGVVDFVYGAGPLMPQYCSNTTGTNPSNPGIIGFSVGSLNGPVSADPQSRDLSHEIPFSTYPESSGNIGLTATGTDPAGLAYSGRAIGGQMLQWHTTGIPTAQNLGIWVLGVADIKRGFPLQNGLTPTQPECILSVTPDVLFVTVPTFGTDVSPTVSFPHGWEGVDFYVQYISYLPAWYSSNALKHTIGLD